MSDKKYDDQDEYKYPDDEQSGEMTTQGNTQQKDDSAQSKIEDATDSHSTKPGIDTLLKKIRQFPLLQNKRAVIIITAVVVLFLLIKIIGGHHSSTSLPKKTKATQAQIQSSLRTEYNVMGTQVRDLSTISVQNKRDVALLTSNIRQMQQSMQSMNDVVVQLTDEVSGLTKEVKTLQAQEKIQKAAQDKQATIKPKVYNITAMVPGRAWLKAKGDNSQGISVRVGDELPTYGKVSSIDSDNGIVTTTSGRIIKFGQNDS